MLVWPEENIHYYIENYKVSRENEYNEKLKEEMGGFLKFLR